MAQIKGKRFNNPRTPMMNGSGIDLIDSAVLAANPTVNDTMDFLLPKGVQVSRLGLYVPDFDASTGIAAKVGWYPVAGTTATLNGVAGTAPSDIYFRAAAAFGQAAGLVECGFVPCVFEEDVMIRITWTAQASGAFTAGEIWCMVAGAYLGVR